MTTFDREMLILELGQLTRKNVLKTDEQARTDRDRVAAICVVLGVEYPEDVLDCE